MKRKAVHIAIALGLVFLFGAHAKGQDYKWLTNNNMMFEVRGHYGFFYHHHFEMEKFNAHFPAFEASIFQSTFGKKEWQILYNYPYIGCTFYHSRLGGFEELGEVFALYPFINYPLFGSETSQFTLKFGLGAAYLTNCFDHLENPYNFSIGSHLNGAVNLSFEYRQQITPMLQSVASVGLTHFSNGATFSPNYGLNTFSGALGIASYFRDPRANAIFAKRPEYYKFEFDGKNWFCLDLNYEVGVKDVSQTMGKSERYLVQEFGVRALAQVTTCSRIGFSLSAVKDNSDKALPDHFVENGKTYLFGLTTDTATGTEYTALLPLHEYQMVKPNLAICYSMTMDRLSYLFELGVHINLRRTNNGIWTTQPVLDQDSIPVTIQVPPDMTEYPIATISPWNMATDISKGSVYQKISVLYNLYDDLYAQIALTTHLARADYLCLGLSYRFHQKYYLNKHAKTKKRPPGVR